MEKSLSKFQVYYRKHRDKRLKQSKENYHKNRDRILKRDRKRYKDNIDYYRMKSLSKEINYLEEWLKVIPLKTKCQICGKEINLVSHSKGNSIHFDHRNSGKEPIKGKPNNWLRSHRFNEKNKKIWLKSNFGYLCCKCNLYLSTKNRKKLLVKMIKYVFGPYKNGVTNDLFGEYKRQQRK